MHTLEVVREAMSDLSWFDCSGTERTLRFFASVESARAAAASFAGAETASVILVANTTQAMGMVASSLPFRPGDNVLIDDQEFLGAVAVWRSISRRLGIELRQVASSNGRTEIDAFRRSADQHTRAVILSSVQEVSGYRSDLCEFGNFAQTIGAYLIVDGIQEAGVVPIHLRELPVDAYCCGGHKWLRSPFGADFLYVAPRFLEQLQPAFSGYTALQEPSEGWQAYLQSPDRGAFDPIPEVTDARRLETGGIPN